MHLADVYTRIRLGWPRRGKIEVHTPPFYTFEDGAETPGRLARAFGEPRRLSAADLASAIGWAGWLRVDLATSD